MISRLGLMRPRRAWMTAVPIAGAILLASTGCTQDPADVPDDAPVPSLAKPRSATRAEPPVVVAAEAATMLAKIVELHEGT